MNVSPLAPRNPSVKELDFLMEEKHRELCGFLCCSSCDMGKQWTDIATKEGVKIMTIPSMNKESMMLRRADFKIMAPMDKIAKIATDSKTFHKVMKSLESVTTIESIGQNCVCLARGVKLNANEPVRESLVACNTRKFGNMMSIVRTSIELDKAPALGTGAIRQ